MRIHLEGLSKIAVEPVRKVMMMHAYRVVTVVNQNVIYRLNRVGYTYMLPISHVPDVLCCVYTASV